MGTFVLVSFIVGGLSGALFGSVIAKGGLAGWLAPSPQQSARNVPLEQRVVVQEESESVAVIKKVSPAVVSIIAKRDFSKVFGDTTPESPFDDPFFNFPFFQPTPDPPQGLQEIGGGSGFIISADGMILTNKHVITIPNADEYTVVMNDGKTFDAKVIATDPATDIGFLKIDGRDLPTVELGDSSQVQIGDTVIAIGNALGQYRNTVTKGIVSGLARTITAGDDVGNTETLRNVIQTDAAINRGNSGGPLLNIAGQAVGINTAINAQGQLIGFALPINVAKRGLESVQRTGKIERPYLGVRYVLINQGVKERNQLSVDYGALVIRGETRNDLAVVPGSPADKAGIVENDIILEIDGQQVSEEFDLAQILQDKEVGQTVQLKVLSKGAEKNVSLKLELRPE